MTIAEISVVVAQTPAVRPRLSGGGSLIDRMTENGFQDVACPHALCRRRYHERGSENASCQPHIVEWLLCTHRKERRARQMTLLWCTIEILATLAKTSFSLASSPSVYQSLTALRFDG